jgi:hypothetical protein
MAFPASAVRLLASAGGVPVAGPTDALDTLAPSATTVGGDPHGAICSWPSSSWVKVMSCGQKSLERTRRLGRLTSIAADGRSPSW